MQNFLFVYRSEPNSNQPSPEEMQANMKRGMDRIGNIAAQAGFMLNSSGSAQSLIPSLLLSSRSHPC